MTDTSKITEFINALMPRKLREQVAAAAQANATVVELPNSGVIEGAAGDAEAQAAKPQPQFANTPGLQTTEAAIQANIERRDAVDKNSDSDMPDWFRQGRQPTRSEMMKMSKDELQFVFKVKESGLIS
jgi:hypothetical protein